MNEVKPPAHPAQHPAARNYVFLCLTALVVIFLVLLRRPIGLLGLLPVLVGALGVGLRWRAAPLMMLILLAGLLGYAEPLLPRGLGRVRARAFRLDDWVLCGAVLAYFTSHYRLQALTLSVFPVDPRRQDNAGPSQGRTPRGPRTGPELRDPRLVSPSEIGWLVLGLPVWALLAQVCWKLLPADRQIYDLAAPTWQGIVLTWALGLGLFVVTGLLGYAGQRLRSGREAALLLQDAVWLETSRDQRRVGRWLAWAALRRRRRKETP